MAVVAQQNTEERVAPAVIFALLTALAVCLSPNVLHDGDTFTHLAAGGWMLQHGAPLRSDPLTATFAGQPWNAHEWLAEVMLAVGFRAGGLTGVVVLTALATSVAFGNLARHVGAVAGYRATLILVTGALLCALPMVLARPHMLALPLLEAWMAGVLAARREGRAPRPWLLGVMAVWANMHGGFAFGLAMAAAMAIEASVAADRSCRRVVVSWWLFVAASVGAGLLTPQGWSGLIFPVQLLGMQSLALIDEWRPMVLARDWPFEGVVFGVVALLATGRVRLPWFRSLLLLGLLHLAFAHVRHSLLFGVGGALLLAEPIGQAFAPVRRQPAWRARRDLGWAGLALALVATVRMSVPIAMANSRVMPLAALAQVPPAVIGTPVLNSNEFGGYLALTGLRPFIDGRVELFGDAFVSDYLAMERPDGLALQRGIERYGLRWALLAKSDPLVARFDMLAGWRRTYADDVAVVFVRS